MIQEFSDATINGLITLEEAENAIGCTLSLSAINTILGAYGFVKQRNMVDTWRKISENPIEPYRHPEPVDPKVLASALELSRSVTWKWIVQRLGMHPTRKSVKAAMKADGWTWVEKRRRWER